MSVPQVVTVFLAGMLVGMLTILVVQDRAQRRAAQRAKDLARTIPLLRDATRPKPPR